MEDEYTPELVKKKPYAKGLSETASAHRILSGTSPQIKLLNALAQTGLLCHYEHPFETGEIHPRYGAISYKCDIFVQSRKWPNEGIDVEVDGLEHYSNLKREMKDRKKEVFLKNKGIDTIRFTNSQATNETALCVVKVLAAVAKRDADP